MAAFRSSLRHYRLLSTTTTTTTTPTIIPKLTFPNRFYDDDGCWETVKTLAISRDFPKIESFIESCKKNPKITEEGYVSTLIRCYGLAGMHDQALNLFNQMEQLSTPRSSLSFNALLACYKLSKKCKLVPKLFDEIPQKYGVSPDKFSYHILIDSLCKTNSITKALWILKDMEKKNVEIGTTVYRMILEVMYKNGMIQRAEKLWKEMTDKGCLPDAMVYNVRIAKAGNPQDILGLIGEMETCGLKPDIASYNCLFTCYSKNGMVEEARKVYDDLEKNGCVPNIATYRLLIFHFCSTKDFDRAYEVFKKSVQEHKSPGYHTLKILVDGLVKSSKREEAKEIIKTVKRFRLDELPNDWTKLEAKLGLNEDEDDLIEKSEVIDEEGN